MAGYDAEFYVAAEANDAVIVTADAKLIEKSKGRAISLEDFASGK